MTCIGKREHWEVSRVYGFEIKSKWDEHEPEVMTENENCKV